MRTTFAALAPLYFSGLAVSVFTEEGQLERPAGRYLRPEPVGDLPLHRLLAEEQSIGQVNVRISDLVDGKWTYLVQYASKTQWASNGCSAESSMDEVNGTGLEPTTYSIIDEGGKYNVPGDIYTSPYLHVCTLSLLPKTTYNYTIDGREGVVGTLLTPPLPGDLETPLKFAVMADVGQTNYSAKTMEGAKEWLAQEEGSSILWPGDLSYADGVSVRWDSFGILAEPLLANVETIWGAGNHETADGESFVPFKARYGGQGSLWHSTKRGMAQIITLCSYCQGGVGSLQYNWLNRTLAAVNRTETPWLIVQFHSPWYCSDVTHVQEAEVQRAAMEPLLVAAGGADFVFAGHVHSYERTNPVVDYNVTECGPVHVTIGDGGNREKVANTWYQQPQWSAERESSFGFGTLVINNATSAEWRWIRNPDGYYQFPNDKDDVQQPFPVTPENFAMDDTVSFDRSACRDF